MKGYRKRRRPVVRRLFTRVKQTFLKLEGEKLRLTIKPDEYVYLDLSAQIFQTTNRGVIRRARG